MRRVAAIVIILASLLLLTACDRSRTKPSADAQQHARLPERTPVQAGYELLDALLLSSTNIELPPGFALPPDLARLTQAGGGIITNYGAAGHFLAQGALAALTAPVQGPDTSARVGFVVYVTAAEAAASFGTERPPWAPVTDRFTPAGFSAPTQCLHVPAEPSVTGGWSFCSVLVGNVKVFGSSFRQDDPLRGNDEHALALARAGVAHLAVVQAAMAHTAATPPRTRVVRVGFLYHSWWLAPLLMRRFQERLAELGYVRGQNLAIEYRFHEDQVERLPELAAELVQERVDVIVAGSELQARAAKQATTTIPVIFIALSDPVQEGLVASLTRPGGNLTGVSTALTPSYYGKLLELLTEAVPSIRRVAVLVEATTGPAWTELERAAQARGVELLPLEVHSSADLEGALAAIAVADVRAILQAGFPAAEYVQAISPFARRRGIPAVYSGTWSGALLSYYASLLWYFGRAADYVDLVLKGANPADLPVELATQYTLQVNLRVARELGLTITPSVLARATEVIP